VSSAHNPIRGHSPVAPPRRGTSQAEWAGTAASWLFALFLSGVTIYLCSDLPVARLYVAAALILCFVCQLRFPDAWLLYVPALLPIFDLTLYSGRLYVTEFDLLILATAAAHFWRAPPGHRAPHVLTRGGILIALLVLVYGASLLIGAWPFPSPDISQLGSYLSHDNAFRVAKSFAWAVLLLGSLQWRLSSNASKAGALFMIGNAIGLILVGLVILWERGVFLTIAHSPGLIAGRYAIAGAILDFTTLYRATAWFSEMHTGGEAIDTYLSLAPPIVAAGIVALRRPALRLLCLFGLGLGTYAVVATFSRGLYISYAGGMLTVFALSIGGAGRFALQGRYALARLGGALVIAIAGLVVAYRFGGYAALIVGLFLAGAAAAVTHFIGDRSRWVTATLFTALCLGGLYALVRAFAGSQYNVMEMAPALLWAAGCVGVLGGAAALVGGGTIRREAGLSAAIGFVIFAAVTGIVIPAIGGSEMTERFSTVTTDSEGRSSHWDDALQLMGARWTDYVFGMGLGSFPRLYFERGEGPEALASYRYGRDGTHTWLSLGVGVFNMEHKVPIAPHTTYELNVLTRSANPNAKLHVRICPKFILSSYEYLPNCTDFNFTSAPAGAWTPHKVAFDSKTLGEDVPLGWPPTLMLYNEDGPTVIDVTNIELIANGTNIVANGDFAAGGDRWLMVSDFNHLAWHVKDLYVAIFFECGIIGLVIFACALLAALINAVRSARLSPSLSIGLAGALVGTLIVGVVGSLLDNPRPAFLLFMALFWALQPLPLAFTRRRS
jgi:hypothetical protein